MEERRPGIQLTFLIKTDQLQDVVGHFGISADLPIGPELNIFTDACRFKNFLFL